MKKKMDNFMETGIIQGGSEGELEAGFSRGFHGVKGLGVRNQGLMGLRV